MWYGVAATTVMLPRRARLFPLHCLSIIVHHGPPSTFAAAPAQNAGPSGPRLVKRMCTVQSRVRPSSSCSVGAVRYCKECLVHFTLCSSSLPTTTTATHNLPAPARAPGERDTPASCGPPPVRVCVCALFVFQTGDDACTVYGSKVKCSVVYTECEGWADTSVLAGGRLRRTVLSI